MESIAGELQAILFLLYATNAGLAVLLALSGRSFPGAWFWVAAQGCLALGTFSDTLPSSVPPWIPLVIGNGIYTLSCLFYAHSAWSFRFGKSFPRWIYGLLPISLLSFALALTGPYVGRALVFSSWMALGSLATAVVLFWKLERRHWVSNGLTAMPFFFLGIGSVLRVVHLASLALSGQDAGSTEVNTWYVGSAVLLSTITLFGYFMMSGIRAEQVVGQKDAEIEARNRKLVESSRAKDLFFSIIAHDLRGPIGGAARYVRKHLLGKMSGLEAKYTEVETLASALEKTNEFLEKLLWWSRAQLQDWVPNRTDLDLAKTFEQSLTLVRSAADLKEIPIELAPGPYPRPVADPESVQLILANLLSNAVKFSLPGHGIRVSVATEGLRCRITVADEGVGMDKQTLERLFRIEDKLTTHGTSGERGSGMGLLLSQSLAERNSGSMEMQSEPGVGTRATLWLPLGS